LLYSSSRGGKIAVRVLSQIIVIITIGVVDTTAIRELIFQTSIRFVRHLNGDIWLPKRIPRTSESYTGSFSSATY